jgi:hypothetical protein
MPAMIPARQRCFSDFAADPAGEHPGDNAGDKARNRRHAADINQVTMGPGNKARDHPHPRAE